MQCLHLDARHLQFSTKQDFQFIEYELDNLGKLVSHVGKISLNTVLH